MLGELELPPSARLKMYRVNTTLSAGELVTLAEAPAGTSGALVGMYRHCLHRRMTSISSGCLFGYCCRHFIQCQCFCLQNPGTKFDANGHNDGAYSQLSISHPVLCLLALDDVQLAPHCG